MQPFPCFLGTSTFMTPLLPAGGWQAVLQPSSSPLTHYEFDVLISAGGGKFVPEGDIRCPCSPRTNVGGWLGGGSLLSPPAGFKRKETRGKLAIGITTNFINRHSRAEVEVAEISGVARIYNQKFFQNLYNKTGQWSQPPQGGCWGLLSPPEGAGGSAPGCPQWWGAFPHMVPHCRGHLVSEPGAGAPCGPGSVPSLSPGIDLENIVYYKDDTHYFVMTAKKQSLLKKGVILQVRRAGSGPGIPQQWAPESLESGMQIVDAGLHTPGVVGAPAAVACATGKILPGYSERSGTAAPQSWVLPG